MEERNFHLWTLGSKIVGGEGLYMGAGFRPYALFLIVTVWVGYGHAIDSQGQDFQAKRRETLERVKDFYKTSVDDYLKKNGISPDHLPSNFPKELPMEIQKGIMNLTPEGLDKMLQDPNGAERFKQHVYKIMDGFQLQGKSDIFLSRYKATYSIPLILLLLGPLLMILLKLRPWKGLVFL